MVAKAKRLAPKPEVLRELFLKSGNLCAYPGCTRLMMNPDGVFIGQVCHISGAEEGGERFSAAMTNEERRSFENLMLMCYDHHQITNDVEKYTMASLRKYKREHERRFTDPDKAILAKLTDWTKRAELREVRNLQKLARALEWHDLRDSPEESCVELNEYIRRFAQVPLEIRHFVGAVASRGLYIEKTRAVRNHMSGFEVLVSDLKGAFKIPDSRISRMANELENYGLGYIWEMETSLGPRPAVRIHHLKSGWPLWLSLAEYCKKAPESMETFTDDLNFSVLDE